MNQVTITLRQGKNGIIDVQATYPNRAIKSGAPVQQTAEKIINYINFLLASEGKEPGIQLEFNLD